MKFILNRLFRTFEFFFFFIIRYDHLTVCEIQLEPQTTTQLSSNFNYNLDRTIVFKLI